MLTTIKTILDRLRATGVAAGIHDGHRDPAPARCRSTTWCLACATAPASLDLPKPLLRPQTVTHE